MPSFSVYFKEEQALVAERFRQIISREGSNVSKHLWAYIVEYVEIHYPGNPQARMTSFMEGGSYDVAAIEGKIRQIFHSRSEKHGVEITLRDIQKVCRAHLDVEKALAMAERVNDWLREQGVNVWR